MTAPTCPQNSDHGAMRLRNGSRGAFYGCSRYPLCRATLDATEVEPSNGTTSNGSETNPIASPSKAVSYTDEQTIENLTALLGRLDPAQRAVVEAIRTGSSNLRVVAAAGSGKTTTTVAAVGDLIRSGVPGSDIVTTTFTNKAGGDLKERLARVVPSSALLWMRVGTFHSLALRALRACPETADRRSSWAFERCMNSQNRASGVPSVAQLWGKVLGWSEVPGLGCPGLNENLGSRGLHPSDYALAADVIRSRGINVGDAEAVAEMMLVKLPGFSKAWRMFEDAKAALVCWDFADALMDYWLALSDGTLRESAKIVLVDEAQDNSKVQLDIAHHLARDGRLVLVGDGRQAIYSWRGAYPELFLRAHVELSADSLELPNNYRSGRRIVQSGNNISHGRDWTVGTNAQAVRDLDGEIQVFGAASPFDEADEVAEKILASIQEGSASPSDFAVLVRTNALAGCFETSLVQRKVPVVVVGGVPFFRRAEVQDALAYCVLSQGDDLSAVERIANRPRRYLGKAFIAALRDAFASEGNLMLAIEKVAPTLRGGSRDGARSLANDIRKLRNTKWPDVAMLVGSVLSPGSEDEDGEADEDRRGLLSVVGGIAEGFETVSDLMTFAEQCAGQVTQVAEGQELPKGRVTISTVHRAKGLEWTHVFVSMSDGNFPHIRSYNDEKRMAEEMRLAYVAFTRARDALTVSWAKVDLRGEGAGPSSFIDYLDRGDDDEDPPSGPTKSGPDCDTQTVVGEVDNGADDSDNPANGGTGLSALRNIADVGFLGGDADQAAAHREETFDLPAYPATIGAVVLMPALKLVQSIASNAKKLGTTADAVGSEWDAARERAKQRMNEEPPAQQGAGGRYVQVTIGAFEELLASLGFTDRTAFHGQTNQRIFALALDDVHVKVFTTIPPNGGVSRDVGEDSIKVAAVHVPSGKPLLARLPYACRTRGWRLVLLDRVERVVQDVLARPRCPDCGAPCMRRRRRSAEAVSMDETSFWGCCTYPACKGINRKVSVELATEKRA